MIGASIHGAGTHDTIYKFQHYVSMTIELCFGNDSAAKCYRSYAPPLTVLKASARLITAFFLALPKLLHIFSRLHGDQEFWSSK
jgi:hypothetical protein